MVCHPGGTRKVALYALIVKQDRVYNYILFNEQDDLGAFVDEGENKKRIEGLFLLLFCRQN